MTASTLTTLSCDRRLPSMTEPRRCGRLFDYRGSLFQARAAARAAGWSSTALSDFCPDHRLRPAPRKAP